MNDGVPAAPQPIRVLVVDDHTIVAESLRGLLDGCADMAVVGVVGSAARALDAAASLHPDVVLMDYQLPDSDGVTAAAQVKAVAPGVNVVMLTGSGDDEELALRAIEAGCSGFLGKGRPVGELLAAVRAARAGEAVISASMLGRLLPRLERGHQGAGAGLSRRELQVLAAMAEGSSDKEIAIHLAISQHTVRKHVQHIIQKLGVHSKLEAVVTAVRTGIIRPL